MLRQFTDYIKENNLCSLNDKILLGVSGGIDSIVMLNLFIQSNYKIGVAHCNFQLRGIESDSDQKFVEEIAKQNNIPFYTKRFKTKKFSSENNLSIQMAARELRYKWFEEIIHKYDYRYIAIGHNLDDVVETFFINLKGE